MSIADASYVNAPDLAPQPQPQQPRYRVRAVVDGNDVTRYIPERSTGVAGWTSLGGRGNGRIVCTSHADALVAIRKEQYLDRAAQVRREFIIEVQ